MMRRIVLGAAVSGLLAASISIGVALAADGDLDTTGFGSGTGKVVTSIRPGIDSAQDLAIQSNGRIVVVGHTVVGSGFKVAVVRYMATGILDDTFGVGYSDGNGVVTLAIDNSNDFGQGVAIQPDGKILVVGIAFIDSVSTMFVARLNEDGVLDETFGIGGTDGNGVVSHAINAAHTAASAVAVQSDGKILAGGYGNGSKFAVMRFTAAGVLDETFGIGGTDGNGVVTTDINGGSAEVYGLHVLAGGSILASGTVTNGSNSRYVIARYTSLGVLDTTFGVGGPDGVDGFTTTDITSGYDGAYGMATQSDGKIILVGDSNASVDRDAAMVRYNSDGSLDTGFGVSGADGINGVVTVAVGTGADYALGIGIQTDGRIVIGGGYKNSDGTDFDGIVVRFLEDGTIDPSFGTAGVVKTPVGSSNDYFAALAIQPDNKIVVVGTSEGTSDDFLIVRYKATTTTATLSSLALSAGSLSPTFALATTSYTASVTNGTSSLTVTPTATDANATISVNGVTTASGAASPSIPLAVGANTVTIALTAQDGVTTKSYTVTVTRAAASVTPTPLTLKVKKTMTAKVALASASKTIPAGAKVSITVAKASKKVCSATSAAIKGLKAGTCTVTIAVTPKATKQVKKPKTTRATITITVN